MPANFRAPAGHFLTGCSKSQPWIDRQGQHPEHQMRHHLGRTPYPYMAGSEFILEPRIDPLTHRALFVSVLLRPRQLRRVVNKSTCPLLLARDLSGFGFRRREPPAF
jgi:hypothetical protein